MTAQALQLALAKADMRPRDRARAVNERLVRIGRADRCIHPTAPYHWVRDGRCPYDPIPRLVAEVLRERIGTGYTVADLWPDHPSSAMAVGAAADGLANPATHRDTVSALEDLVGASAASRAEILPVGGVELVTVALDGARQTPDVVRAARDGDVVRLPMVDLIDEHIAALRRLDDRQGGGPLSLRYVIGELNSVTDLITGAAYTQQIGRRLLSGAGELAQLAGWMSFDAGAAGAAQRFFLLGLRAARSAEDDAGAANILGMLSYQAAVSGQPQEAIRLGEAAERLAQRASAGIQARIAGRLATAHAAAGDLYAFRDSADRAKGLLARRCPDDDPPWLYYLSSEQLAAETGQALADLAERNPGHSARLLTEAVDLLAPLSSAGLREDYQRSALLHGSYLAAAHLRRRDLEAASRAATAAAQRLPGVASGRCRRLLNGLRASLARRKRNPWAADAVERLDAVLVVPTRR